MKLHPQNETPGDMGPAPSLEPVSLREIADVMDLIILSLRTHVGPSYYADAAAKRLDNIIKRLPA